MIDYSQLEMALAELQAKEEALERAKQKGQPIEAAYYDLKKQIGDVNTILEAGKGKGHAENGTDTAICRDAMAEGQQRQ